MEGVKPLVEKRFLGCGGCSRCGGGGCYLGLGLGLVGLELRGFLERFVWRCGL